MKQTTEIFEITEKLTDKDILEQEELGFLSGPMVRAGKIHECYLKEKGWQTAGAYTAISIMLSPEEYKLILNENELIVKTDGKWWSELSDKNVKVYTSKSNIRLHPLKLF